MNQPSPAEIPTARPADAPPDNLVDRFAPQGARPYLRMARIDRPIGWWLLLLPCWWSSALAAVSVDRPPNPLHILLFLVGAVAMRGAGSVWNDIVDRDLDGSVARTRNRPLPSGQITVTGAALFAGLLCLIGLGVLLSFNAFAIGLGFLSLLPVAFYPFMKRRDRPSAGGAGARLRLGRADGLGGLSRLARRGAGAALRRRGALGGGLRHDLRHPGHRG